jgi:hypothetical protein
VRAPFGVPLVLKAINITAIEYPLNLSQNRFVIFTKFNLEHETNFRQPIAVFVEADAKASFAVNKTNNIVWIQHRVHSFLPTA